MSFQRILVPVDFSECSKNALENAISVARKGNSGLVMLHAYHVPVPHVEAGASAMVQPLMEGYEQNVQQDFKELRDSMSGMEDLDVEEVIVAARPYLIWMAVMPFLGFASYIWDGIFVGLTASVAMRNSMMVSLAGYLAVFYLTEPHLQMHALWLSLAVFLVFRGAIQHWMYARKGHELT